MKQNIAENFYANYQKINATLLDVERQDTAQGISYSFQFIDQEEKEYEAIFVMTEIFTPIFWTKIAPRLKCKTEEDILSLLNVEVELVLLDGKIKFINSKAKRAAKSDALDAFDKQLYRLRQMFREMESNHKNHK